MIYNNSEVNTIQARAYSWDNKYNKISQIEHRGSEKRWRDRKKRERGSSDAVVF